MLPQTISRQETDWNLLKLFTQLFKDQGALSIPYPSCNSYDHLRRRNNINNKTTLMSMSLNICTCTPLFISKIFAYRYYWDIHILLNTERHIYFNSTSFLSAPLHFYEKVQLYLRNRLYRELSTIKIVQGTRKFNWKMYRENTRAGWSVLLL